MAVTKEEAKAAELAGNERATEEQETQAPRQSPAVDKKELAGRYSVRDAIRRFNTPFALDRTRRSFVEKDVRKIVVDAIDTPATKEFPHGMFGRFLLLNTVTKRIEDYGMTVSICGFNEFRDEKGAERKEAYSQTNIRFRNGILCPEHVQSVDVLRYLFHNDRYGVDWIIDVDDPGGFWEMVGKVKRTSREVKVAV